MTTKHALPDGPVTNLVKEICGTDIPRRSAAWENGHPGFHFFGIDRDCQVFLLEPGRWLVKWEESGEEKTAEFLRTWERVS